MAAKTDVEDLRRERDLYALLLDDDREDDVATVLRAALAFAVARVGARQGYVAIYPSGRARKVAPRWSHGQGCDEADVERMHALVSSSIIDDVLQTRRLTAVPSAMGHPRYADMSSVQTLGITSVICTPLGSGNKGVLYVQGRKAGGIFSAADEEEIARLSRRLTPHIDRLVAQHADDDPADATAGARRGGRYVDVIGRSEALGQALSQLTEVSSAGGLVWLVGAPGTGKALLARSLRREGAGVARVVELDAASLSSIPSDDLDGVPSELLLLRRIERASPAAQARVLAALEERSGPRIVLTSRGRSGAPVEGLVPALAARLGRFRVDVPPLEHRGADVELLAASIGREAAARAGQPWSGITLDALHTMRAVAWEDGVRELTRRIQRGVERADGGPLGRDHLFAPVAAADEGAGDVMLALLGKDLVPWRTAKHTFERAYLEHALERHGGDIERTAAALGMSRSRCYELLRERDLKASAAS